MRESYEQEQIFKQEQIVRSGLGSTTAASSKNAEECQTEHQVADQKQFDADSDEVVRIRTPTSDDRE